jgi:hypothetical protein
MKWCSFISLFSFLFLCSVGAVQSMELEIISEKAISGSTCQSKPLKEVGYFYPELNEPFSLLFKQALPVEIWRKIWDYLDRNDQLNFGSISRLFKRIRLYVRVDVCFEKFSFYWTKLQNESLENKDHCTVYLFYECTKTVCNICDSTKVKDIKVRCKAFFEENKSKAEEIIKIYEPRIKKQRHYSANDDYKRLKYLKKVFKIESDTCNVCCAECKDGCYYTGRNCLFYSCIPCASCIFLWWACGPEDD